MNKKAILLAGGAGTRLFPITKIVCKQLLPVYDKPMICYPLATLMLGGSARHPDHLHAQRICRCCANSWATASISEFGSNMPNKPKPEGIAQAFLIGAKFIGDSGRLLDSRRQHLLRKTRFFPGGAGDRERGAYIFAYQVHDPQRYGVVDFGPEGAP